MKPAHDVKGPDEPACASCPPARGRKKGVLAVLLCAHCTLTIFAAGAVFAFAAIPPVLGINFEWVLPPFFFLGIFGIWLWWGHHASGAQRRSPLGAPGAPHVETARAAEEP